MSFVLEGTMDLLALGGRPQPLKKPSQKTKTGLKTTQMLHKNKACLVGEFFVAASASGRGAVDEVDDLAEGRGRFAVEVLVGVEGVGGGAWPRPCPLVHDPRHRGTVGVLAVRHRLDE